MPKNAKPGKGGFPLKLDPQVDQVIWIEVYTVRGLPAGICDGSVLVNADGALKDHQYLTLAQALGLDASVQESLTAVVPQVFSEAKGKVGFAETGDAYEAARLRLAQSIETLLRQGAGARRSQ